jgi:hypothetical protein
VRKKTPPAQAQIPIVPFESYSEVPPLTVEEALVQLHHNLLLVRAAHGWEQAESSAREALEALGNRENRAIALWWLDFAANEDRHEQDRPKARTPTRQARQRVERTAEPFLKAAHALRQATLAALKDEGFTLPDAALVRELNTHVVKSI